MKLCDFLPELIEALDEHLRADDVRWGDTWLKRPRTGQDERFVMSTMDRLDRYRNAGQPIDYLAIIGDAMINWLRQRHPELWTK